MLQDLLICMAAATALVLIGNAPKIIKALIDDYKEKHQ